MQFKLLPSSLVGLKMSFFTFQPVKYLFCIIQKYYEIQTWSYTSQVDHKIISSKPSGSQYKSLKMRFLIQSPNNVPTICGFYMRVYFHSVSYLANSCDLFICTLIAIFTFNHKYIKSKITHLMKHIMCKTALSKYII